jgi:Mg/Co/Ni transporter MgtE
MADIMEDLDSSTQAEIFSAMETERAADVLEELESDTRESLLESLPADKMADVLEIMPADEAADILDEVDEEKADLLLREMDSEASVKIRDLMEYEDYEVGSLMTTDFVCFRETNTVEATLDVLRREKPESDMIYYLYIVTDTGELQAEVSLRDFVVSSPNARLGDIMNRDIVFVQDTDKIEALHDMIAKYSMLAVPVVDAFQKLVGIVIINDVIFTLLRSKRRRP